MARVVDTIQKGSEDHFYLDVSLYNDSSVINPARPFYVPASINQTRSAALLENPSDWNISIVRLSVNSSAIPRITESTSSLVVGYMYNNVFYDVPVVIPFSPDPGSGLPTQSLYNIQQFVNLVNAAFFTAQTAAAGGGAVFAYGQVFLTYSSETGLFSLYIPSYFGTGTTSTSPATIGVTMSFDMSQRLNSFPVVQNFPLQNNGHDVIFDKQFTGLNQVTLTALNTLGPAGPVVMAGNYMILVQDSAWPSSVENVNRVVVTTSMLPAITEYRSTALFSQNAASNNNQTANVLTDFFAGSNLNLSNRSDNFNYVPQVYRLSSLSGNQPIVSYDITVGTIDRFGAASILRIPPGGSVSLKILFLKKGLSN